MQWNDSAVKKKKREQTTDTCHNMEETHKNMYIQQRKPALKGSTLQPHMIACGKFMDRQNQSTVTESD